MEKDSIQIFKNEEFGDVRVVYIEGVSYFVGKDVATSLGYAKPENAIATHVDDEDKTTTLIQGTGSNYKSNAVCINESGLYSLILSSKLPSAKKFKRWVTAEVLPSIREHGMYATDDIIDQILNNPDLGIKLLTQLKEERTKRKEAENTVAILTHVNKTYTMTEIAKEAGMQSAQQLNNVLKDVGVQYKSNGTWVMYSKYSALGYEQLKQTVLDDGTVIYYRRITQRGREFILKELGKL